MPKRRKFVDEDEEKPKYFKTEVKILVLSEDPLDDVGIRDIVEMIDDGDASGLVNVGPSIEISGKKMAKILSADILRRDLRSQ
jgi:hypothetical protein